jgi:hypothetical protein
MKEPRWLDRAAILLDGIAMGGAENLLLPSLPGYGIIH